MTRRALALAAGLGLSLAAGSAAGGDRDTWSAFMMGVPDRLELNRSIETATNYTLKQTHEPLFRKDDGENYSSKLLQKWDRDLSWKNFSFCPAAGLAFGDGTPFDDAFFGAYLSSVTARYGQSFSMSGGNGCRRIAFASAEPGYLDYLSKYENSPSTRSAGGMEEGLGPFRIVSMGGGRAVLLRKKRTRNGYNRIVLNEFRGPADPEYKASRASDYNNVPVYYQPAWLENDYQGVDTVDLQTTGVVINVRDAALRSLVYNCLDADKFRHAFFPDRREFLDISTVLPIGVVGARPGKPAQNCGAAGRQASRPLILLDHINGNDEKLAAVAEEFRVKTGVTIEVVKCTPGELVKALQKRPRGYDMIVVSVSAIQSEYSLIFDYFAESYGFYDFQIPGAAAAHSRLQHERDGNAAAALASKLADGIGAGHYFLPLHQNMRRLYYPKGIKELEVGKGFIQYPEVADFKW